MQCLRLSFKGAILHEKQNIEIMTYIHFHQKLVIRATFNAVLGIRDIKIKTVATGLKELSLMGIMHIILNH